MSIALYLTKENKFLEIIEMYTNLIPIPVGLLWYSRGGGGP